MSEIFEWQRGSFCISTDTARLDVDAIHAYLYHAYWSPGVPRDRVEKAIQHSLNFGLYDEETTPARQIGFARVVSDHVSFAYLADVYVLSDYRGHGLGIWLIDCMLGCPELSTLRSFWLATQDAHGMYAKFGFETPADPTRMMVKVYQNEWRDDGLVIEAADPARAERWLAGREHE